MKDEWKCDVFLWYSVLIIYTQSPNVSHTDFLKHLESLWQNPGLTLNSLMTFCMNLKRYMFCRFHHVMKYWFSVLFFPNPFPFPVWTICQTFLCACQCVYFCVTHTWFVFVSRVSAPPGAPGNTGNRDLHGIPSNLLGPYPGDHYSSDSSDSSGDNVPASGAPQPYPPPLSDLPNKPSENNARLVFSHPPASWFHWIFMNAYLICVSF